MKYTTHQLVLAMATAVGAFGGFPAPPQAFTEMVSQNELFRYVLLFVLIWQGGAGQDPRLAAMITAAMYAIIKSM